MNQVRNTGRKARRHQILPGCMRLYNRVLALMDLRADVVVAMPWLIEYVPEEKTPKHGGSSELKPESKGASRRYRSHRELARKSRDNVHCGTQQVFEPRSREFQGRWWSSGEHVCQLAVENVQRALRDARERFCLRPRIQVRSRLCAIPTTSRTVRAHTLCLGMSYIAHLLDVYHRLRRHPKRLLQVRS